MAATVHVNIMWKTPGNVKLQARTTMRRTKKSITHIREILTCATERSYRKTAIRKLIQEKAPRSFSRKWGPEATSEFASRERMNLPTQALRAANVAGYASQVSKEAAEQNNARLPP